MPRDKPMSDSSPGLFRRLLSGVWNLISWIRTSIANLLFVAILVLIVITLLPQEPPQLAEKGALRLAPSGVLVDQRSYIEPLQQLLGDSQRLDSETLVRDLVNAINYAAKDKRITTLVLELDHLAGGGISKLEEIGIALTTFKATGKSIIAVSDSYSQEQYYLASYANEIYLHPMGTVALTGYGAYRNYFKSALEKLAVNFHVFRVGQYKDFVEPYTRNGMSDASREHNTQWLNELWGVYTSRIETLRNLPKGAVNDYINNLDAGLKQEQGNSAQLALKTGLVDQLKTRLEMRRELIAKIGADEEGNNYQAVSFKDYLTLIESKKAHHKDQVGLLVAQGTIIDGEQPSGNIGGDTLAKLLRDARNNTNMKALVLRVDSGGGSAFASEVIREELAATQMAGIPVVVSMGSVAASGGYWITTAADEVWATPTTITGSIGVFGLFPTLEKSLDKLGVHTDGVGTTELAGAIRPDRALPPQAQSVIQQSVEDIYNRFLGLVAEARASTPEKIHTIAQGRVWTGSMAKNLGLVDELGYLNDAIAAAARHAGLEQYDITLIKKPLTPKEQLLKELTGGSVAASEQVSTHALVNLLPAGFKQWVAPLIEPLSLMWTKDPRHIYAQCLICTAP